MIITTLLISGSLISPIYGMELSVGNTYEYEILEENVDPLNLVGTITDRFSHNNIDLVEVAVGYIDFFQSGFSESVPLPDDPDIDYIWFSSSVSYRIGSILLADSGIMMAQSSPDFNLNLIATIYYLNGTRISTYIDRLGDERFMIFDGFSAFEYCTTDIYASDFSQVNNFECAYKFFSEDYEFLQTYDIRTSVIQNQIVSQYLENPEFSITKVNENFDPNSWRDQFILEYLKFTTTSVEYEITLLDETRTGSAPSDTLDSGWVANYTMGVDAMPDHIDMTILKDPEFPDQSYDMTLVEIDYEATLGDISSRNSTVGSKLFDDETTLDDISSRSFSVGSSLLFFGILLTFPIVAKLVRKKELIFN